MSKKGKKSGSADRGSTPVPSHPLPGESLQQFWEAQGGELEFLKNVELRALALKDTIDTCTLACSLDHILRAMPMSAASKLCEIMEKPAFPTRSHSLRVEDKKHSTVMVYIGLDLPNKTTHNVWLNVQSV